MKNSSEKTRKFQDPYTTADSKDRASVRPKELKTLWFNTGTLCNLSCANCYIESSPRNDRLVYINENDVKPYLNEIKEKGFKTQQIAFTGGEPFLNPHMIGILKMCLEKGFEALVLTNAFKAIDRYQDQLTKLKDRYGNKLILRISLDHYKKEVHEKERGPKTFNPTLEKMKELYDKGFKLGVAGRSLIEEDHDSAIEGFKKLLWAYGISLDYEDPNVFVIFPEMDESVDVPEITTDCWEILGKKQEDIMCSSSRMIVKRKGEVKTKVLACTLIPYDSEFELGETLTEARKPVYLNHPHCSKFCVLGGASCSA
jgi:MoaA/NifB/PqqE/SkfB family radical SAM enzyme